MPAKKTSKPKKPKEKKDTFIKFTVGKKKFELLHPFRLDIACGQSKTPGFFGVDIAKGKDVDLVWDLEKFPWPFPDSSVDEVVCNHYVEHTKDLISFMNELHRVMVPGGQALIRAPYYNSIRAWQDPTHTRAISEATFLYYNQGWLKQNKLDHYPITADFDYSFGYDFMPDWAMRAEEARAFAVRHYTNVVADIQVVLVKK